MKCFHPTHTDWKSATRSTVSDTVAAVEEAELDLLVMGSHGHTGLSDLIQGETAGIVRHRVAIPVLIVKSGTPKTAIPKNGRPD